MPDPATLADLGLAGLFVAAFLAGSVLSFPSEPVLLGVVAGGVSGPGPALLAATLGNVLGAATIYALGRGIARGGGGWAGARLERRLGGPEERERARARFERWGAAALLLAWLPFVGDPIVLGAALAGVRTWPFLALVTAGKAARYAALLLVA